MLDFFRRGRKSATTLDILKELYGAWRESRSGRAVTLETAVQVAAVFACLRVKGNGVAQVPLKLMRLSPDGKTRLPAIDHPIYQLLALKPNPWQTSFEFRQMLTWHVELAGNFYAFKNAPLGTLREIIPFPDPCAMKRILKSDGETEFEYRTDKGEVQRFPAEAIWHVRGPSWDGRLGIDVLRVAREAIGLSVDIEEAQASLARNGVQTSGSWSVEGKLEPEQQKKLAKWIEDHYAGAKNAGKPLILDRAAKWMSTAMTGVDAQVLETRRHQIEEVCRFFGVMPIMAGYSDKTATFASAEAMFLAHIVHCLSPLWTALEQSMSVNLLTEKDRQSGLYFDFVEEGMLRGSMRDTKDAILGYVNGGILTPNEGRALLDRNPDPDPESDRLRIPVNVAQEPAATEPRTEGAPPA